MGALPDSSCFNLISNWYKCVKTDFREDLSVFVCTAYSCGPLEDIQNFVAEGGGLLVGGHAWYWAQTHPQENTMTDFVGELPEKKHHLFSDANSVACLGLQGFTRLRSSSVFEGTSCSTKWV